MVRRTNRRQQQNPRRRNRRRAQRSRQQRSRAVLPPAKTIFGHLVRNVVQTAWDIAQGVLSRSTMSSSPFDVDEDFSIMSQANPTSFSLTFEAKFIFAHGWLDRIKTLFREYRLHSLTAHYVPYATIDAPGEYCMTLFDANQDATPGTFYGGIGAPASIIRPQRMPAKLTWVPTEPDDKNWHDFGDGHKWCTLTLFAAESSYVLNTGSKIVAQPASIAGKLVFEVDASFRGTTSIPSPRSLAPYGSLAYSEHQRIVACSCNKCLRFARASGMSAAPTISTMNIQSP